MLTRVEEELVVEEEVADDTVTQELTPIAEQLEELMMEQAVL